jgi:osmotically-inducible protein OsmY
VESGEQKEKAETVARSVPGVKRLVSTLEVASDRSRGSAQPSK